MFYCPARPFLEIHDMKAGSYSNALFSTGILELLGSKLISGHKLTSMSFVDLQLDAQNSYLFTYITFIKILYMFGALPCSSSGGPRRNCTYAAPGIVTLCR